MKDLSRILKALADPTRLRLLNLLLHHHTVCVCEMVEITGITQYNVSRHLGLLRREGLVVDSREGARINYAMAPGLSKAVEGLVECMAEHLESTKEGRRDLARADQLLPASRRRPVA